jgi:hypothetical protein
MPPHPRLEDVARSLVRRFPSWEDRSTLAGQVGLGAEVQLSGDALASWTDIVRTAAAKGRLEDLLRAATLRRPGDPELAGLLAPSRARSRTRVPLLLLALVVSSATAWSLLRNSRVPDPSLQEVATPSAPGVATEPAGDPPPSMKADPTEPTEPTEALTTLAPAPDPAPLGGCRAESGVLIGYWYSARDPGPVGTILEIPQGANVRADFPRRENGWNARAPLVCGLLAGMRVRISEPPMKMPRGDHWVPLRGGDLMR